MKEDTNLVGVRRISPDFRKRGNSWAISEGVLLWRTYDPLFSQKTA